MSGPKNPAAVSLGKRGGEKRAASLTPERRAEIAKTAAAKKWANYRDKQGPKP
jgi:hypothetical protein